MGIDVKDPITDIEGLPQYTVFYKAEDKKWALCTTHNGQGVSKAKAEALLGIVAGSKPR